jgi:hypothetical protein
MIQQAAVSSAVPPTSAPNTLSSTSQKYPITEEVAEKTADGQPPFKKMRTDEAAVCNTMVAIPVPNGKKEVPMNPVDPRLRPDAEAKFGVAGEDACDAG